MTMMTSTNANLVLDALLHLAHQQLRSGLYEDAAGTFSAAIILDETDDRAVRGRSLAFAQIELATGEKRREA